MEDNKKTEAGTPDSPSPAAQLELLNAKIEALEKEVAALKQQLASAPAATSVNIEVTPKAKKTPVCPEFKLGAKTYLFKMPAFILGETRYVAEEITNDKALLEKIVKEYPGIIQEK